MNELKVSFTPTQEELNQLYNWTTFPQSNWSVIDKSFREGNLCIALIQNNVVGFFSYSLEAVSIFIKIAETSKNYQNKGIAKLIKSEIEKKFINTKYKAFYLYCEPKSSQFIWKKLGFDYFPEKAKGGSNELIYMYSIFGNVAKLSTTNYEDFENQNSIEIWGAHNSKDQKPIFFSTLDCHLDGKTLLKPVLFFGNRDWKIRLKYNEKIFEGRYKDYDRSSEIYECFYIEKLK
ncbi:GNAT family N-acetyltransferase [Empedobacter brevis]|uniref:GNAT family N-acetyltransferase n=1 Tax=Empedobacter brevis TaxID=247 RepID=UPI0028A7031E|nr:GNAT family N-acetyltransferase [Empedobacter brevis]